MWRDFFVACVIWSTLMRRSFCCSGPGKYHYSPERLKKTELCQGEEFHLGRRNGRRSSGLSLFLTAWIWNVKLLRRSAKVLCNYYTNVYVTWFLLSKNPQSINTGGLFHSQMNTPACVISCQPSFFILCFHLS